MSARIYQPARSAMTSGAAATRRWILEFTADGARELDPLMGWTGSADTRSQVRLSFPSREAAEAYARSRDIEATVIEPKRRRPAIRPRGYGENFATDRRMAWTH